MTDFFGYVGKSLLPDVSAHLVEKLTGYIHGEGTCNQTRSSNLMISISVTNSDAIQSDSFHDGLSRLHLFSDEESIRRHFEEDAYFRELTHLSADFTKNTLFLYSGYSDKIYVADLRNKLGQIWVFNNPQYFRYSIESVGREVFSQEDVIINFPKEHSWSLGFVNEIWKIRKFKVTFTLPPSPLKEEEEEQEITQEEINKWKSENKFPRMKFNNEGGFSNN
jgi:hypothetical protein